MEGRRNRLTSNIQKRIMLIGDFFSLNPLSKLAQTPPKVVFESPEDGDEDEY